MRAINRFAALAALAVVPLIACSDSGTGPDLGDDGIGNAPAPQFDVVLAADGGTASSSLGVSAKLSAASAGIPLDAIVAINVTIDRVEVHRNASGEGGSGGWQSFDAVNPELNLVNLPADGIELVDGTLEQGTYDKLRLVLTGQPTIELSQDVVVNNRTIAAGVHDLDIPSSQNSGIKIDGAFSVSDDGQSLRILFDAAAAVSNIHPAGNGAIKMPPKMKVQDKDGDDVGDTDSTPDDEDDGDDDGATGDVDFDGPVTAADAAAGSFELEDGRAYVLDEGVTPDAEGDLATLEEVAQAVSDGQSVRAEGHGTLEEVDGTVTVRVTAVKFEVDEAQDGGDTDDGDAGASSADFDVLLGSVESPPASGLLGSGQLQAASGGGDIPASAIDAINVTVARVEVHGHGGWHTVGTPEATVNLLDLPGGGISLVDTELATGDYNQLRLILTGQSSIELNSEVELSKGKGNAKDGGSLTLGPGTVKLHTPSADASGIKFKGDFTVGAGGELLLVLFDDAETIERLKVTGSGDVKMRPVFHLTDAHGEEIGESEELDDEDDGEDGDDGDDDGDDEDGHDDDGDDDGDEAGVDFQGLVTGADPAAGGFTLDDGRSYVLGEGVSPDAEGDLATLDDVLQALADGLAVRAEGDGELAEDGTTITVSAVKFETDDEDGEETGDDGEGDADDDADDEDGASTSDDDGKDKGNKGGNGKGKGGG